MKPVNLNKFLIISVFLVPMLLFIPLSVKGEAPISQEQEVEVTLGDDAHIILEAEGEFDVFEITTDPEFGSLTNIDGNKVVYTPEEEEEADQFGFVAKSLVSTKLKKEGLISPSSDDILNDLIGSLENNISEDNEEIEVEIKMKIEEDDLDQEIDIKKGSLTSADDGLLEELVEDIKKNAEDGEGEIEIEIEIEIEQDIQISEESFVYIIINVPDFLPIEWNDDNSSTKVKTTKDMEVSVSEDSQGSTIILEEDTEITREDGEELDSSSITYSEVDPDTLENSQSNTLTKGSIKWGVDDVSLNLSKPITINIKVDQDLNGETLDVFRSIDGANWTNDGIEPPATCVVSEGVCTFKATKASYYAAFQNISNEEDSQPASTGSGSSFSPSKRSPSSSSSSPPSESENEVQTGDITDLANEDKESEVIEEESNDDLANNTNRYIEVAWSHELPNMTIEPVAIIEAPSTFAEADDEVINSDDDTSDSLADNNLFTQQAQVLSWWDNVSSDGTRLPMVALLLIIFVAIYVLLRKRSN